jgi:hypothetical protein
MMMNIEKFKQLFKLFGKGIYSPYCTKNTKNQGNERDLVHLTNTDDEYLVSNFSTTANIDRPLHTSFT